MERNLSSVHAAPHWSPASWKTKPARQQPTYRDAEALSRALAELRLLPPLVTSWEVLTLKRKKAAERKELFEDGLISQLIREGKVKKYPDVINRVVQGYRG